MPTERPRARAYRLMRQALAEGRYPVGMPLPAERDMAEACAVSRNTLRWVLQRLVSEGLLDAGGARIPMVVRSGADRSVVTGAVYLYSFDNLGNIPTSAAGWSVVAADAALKCLRAAGRTVVMPCGGVPDAADLAAFARTPPGGVLLTAPLTFGGLDKAHVAAVAALAAAKVPTVTFSEAAEGCDHVISDHEAGAHALTSWLLERGRRRPLCLWPSSTWVPAWKVRRRAGFERALAERGIEPLPIEEFVLPPNTREPGPFQDAALRLAGHLAGHLLANPPVDAILALSDGDVPAISAALRLCRKEPGRDVDVVGYDAYWNEVPEKAFCSDPPVATVDKDNAAIGHVMSTLLLERMAGGLPAPPQTRLVVPRLQLIAP